MQAGVASHVPEAEHHGKYQHYQPHHNDYGGYKDVHSSSHDYGPKEWNWSADKEKYSTGKENKNSTPLTALTLLAFFFFLNMLQSCIKDHMDAINPTALVLTPQINRKRFTKAKTNSREETMTPVIDPLYTLEAESNSNHTESSFIEDRIETPTTNSTSFLSFEAEEHDLKAKYFNNTFSIQLERSTPTLHLTHSMPYLPAQHRSSEGEKLFQKISSFQAYLPNNTQRGKVVKGFHGGEQAVKPTLSYTHWTAVSLFTHRANP